jgi:hypothetical protein
MSSDLYIRKLSGAVRLQEIVNRITAAGNKDVTLVRENFSHLSEVFTSVVNNADAVAFGTAVKAFADAIPGDMNRTYMVGFYALKSTIPNFDIVCFDLVKKLHEAIVLRK